MAQARAQGALLEGQGNIAAMAIVIHIGLGTFAT
jgi:hypothetical protein